MPRVRGTHNLSTFYTKALYPLPAHIRSVRFLSLNNGSAYRGGKAASVSSFLHDVAYTPQLLADLSRHVRLFVSELLEDNPAYIESVWKGNSRSSVLSDTLSYLFQVSPSQSTFRVLYPSRVDARGLVESQAARILEVGIP